MHLHWKSFSICKNGNREEENEDAVYPVLPAGNRFTTERFCCVMTDGATQSSFSRLWASLLANEVGSADDLPHEIHKRVTSARQSWHVEIDSKPLPWPAEIKVRQGAHSTLLWFVISDHQEWKAGAVGDTCLFHFRKDKLLFSYPLTHSAQFSNSTDLISSNKDHHHSSLSKPAVRSQWERGDVFILATDALADWIIRNQDASGDSAKTLKHHLSSYTNYSRWVTTLRRQTAIKNDDTSVIFLEVDF